MGAGAGAVAGATIAGAGFACSQHTRVHNQIVAGYTRATHTHGITNRNYPSRPSSKT
jgi:hypothetical protein